MYEKTVEVETRDGRIPTFMTHPEEGGPHPAVIIYMDAPGIREELRDVARRIGTVGYCAVLPDLYYRQGGGSFPPAEKRTEAQTGRMRELMGSLSSELIVEDTHALLGWLDGEAGARPGAMGCIGYCMSGPFVLSVCAAFPERFKAGVSLHGVHMLTDAPDSPHTRLGQLQGEHYYGFGEDDPLVPMDEVEALRQAVAAAGAPVRIDVHPRAGHGFGFAQRSEYNKVEAERAWERTFALYRRVLG